MTWTAARKEAEKIDAAKIAITLIKHPDNR